MAKSRSRRIEFYVSKTLVDRNRASAEFGQEIDVVVHALIGSCFGLEISKNLLEIGRMFRRNHPLERPTDHLSVTGW